MEKWENLFKQEIAKVATAEDPAHDIQHFQRVVKTAKFLCAEENAKMDVVVPAAWLHDLVIVPKNDPRRSQASRLSAEAAMSYLSKINYPEVYFTEIALAIECHSFSARIEAKTIEAKIVQDADRLDGLGAIGIARCFATSGVLKRPFYNGEDPFCEARSTEDHLYALDHFYQKLFKTADTLQTEAGRKEGHKRALVMRNYLNSLRQEII